MTDPSTADQRSALRPGVRLCLDWGKARIGVAACDAACVLCYPVETIPNGKKLQPQVLARLAELAAEYQPLEIVMGLPTDLRGEQGTAARDIVQIAERLGEALGVALRLVDERMSSVSAHRKLAEAGRSTRQRKTVIDQAAAVAILEHALESERRTGVPAGRLAAECSTSDAPPSAPRALPIPPEPSGTVVGSTGR